MLDKEHLMIANQQQPDHLVIVITIHREDVIHSGDAWYYHFFNLVLWFLDHRDIIIIVLISYNNI